MKVDPTTPDSDPTAIERELQRRIAAWHAAELTEADVQRFVLDAAQLIGQEPYEMVGDSPRFRWRLGERAIEVGAHPPRPGRPGWRLTVGAFGFQAVVEIAEHFAFESADISAAPYLWAMPIGERPSELLPPDTPIYSNWEEFEEYLGPVLQELPSAVAMTPAQWRREVGASFELSPESGFGELTLRADATGLRVRAAAGDQARTWLIPRAQLESRAVRVTEVVAGFAAGAPIATLSITAHPGLSLLPMPLDLGDDEPTPPGVQLSDLDGLLASQFVADEVPNGSATQFPRALTPAQIADQIEAFLAGSGEFELLRENGWELGPHSDGRRLTSPTPPEPATHYDTVSLCQFCWELSEELTARQGAPFGTSDATDGTLFRWFAAGSGAIELRTAIGIVQRRRDASAPWVTSPSTRLRIEVSRDRDAHFRTVYGWHGLGPYPVL